MTTSNNDVAVKDEIYAAPIPMGWLRKVLNLKVTCALGVALALWREAEHQGTQTVSVPNARLMLWDAHHTSIQRGIRHLERAGLIRVERKANGRKVGITLVA
ncbi:MAG: hypothetical protein HUU31_24170 [Anaerolineae bacterium]|nr:hypothetical protein [Anaerolineae bacterium]